VLLGRFSIVSARLGASHPILHERLLRPHCRVCGLGLAPGRTSCDDEHDPTIACVSCGQGMKVVELGGLVIDVCRACRAAWFDEGELGATVRTQAGDIRARVRASLARPPGGGPTRGVGGLLRETAGDAVSLARTAFDPAETAVELVVDGVFDVLGSVVDIFDGS
jgi:hypothetical protein